MEHKASYFKIGVFVMTATVIGIGAVIFLGLGALAKDSIIYETYVDESIQGLDVGAPVKYRGVKVGSLSNIEFVAGRYDVRKPYVLLELAFDPKSTDALRGSSLEEQVEEMIESGLRVRVASAGLTGAMYLEVDFVDPEKHPPLEITWTPANRYLPSVKSTVAQFTDQAGRVLDELETAEIGRIGRNLNRLLEELTLMVEGDLKETLTNVNAASAELAPTLSEIRETMGEDLKAQLEDMVGSLDRLIDGDLARTLAVIDKSFERISDDVGTLVARVDGTLETDLSPALANLNRATEGLPKTVETMNRTIRRVDHTVFVQGQNLEELFSDLRSISSDLQSITEDARRQPSRLLFGKPPPRK